jgi:lipid-A-disaccharide synthase
MILVGHPCVKLQREDVLAALDREATILRRDLGIGGNEKVIGVFPGSRAGPIELLMGTMIDAACRVVERSANVRVLVSIANPAFAEEIRRQVRRRLIGKDSPYSAGLGEPESRTRVVPIHADSTVLLRACDCAILSSGTITLEAACLGVPGVVVYDLRARTGRRAWLIRATVKRGRNAAGSPVPFSLPSNILGETVYPEFVLADARSEVVAETMLKVIADLSAERQRLQRVSARLFQIIGSPQRDEDGNIETPMECVAREIISLASGEPAAGHVAARNISADPACRGIGGA